MEGTHTIRRGQVVNQRTFRFNMHVKAFVGLMGYENSVEALLRQTRISKNGKNDVFEIALLEYKQTNDKGVHEWDKDLNKIKNRLVFEVDAADGSPVMIMNRTEIVEKWQKIRPIMLNDYKHTDYFKYMVLGTDSLLQDENRFTKATSAANEHIMLMPGIYGTYKTDEAKSISARSIRSVLPGIHLPIKAVCRLEKYDQATGACNFSVDGTPDYEHFEEDKFQEAIKEITETFNARTTMEVSYLEKYELDEYQWLSSAGRIYHYYLPGLISNETICTLTQEN